MHFSRTLGKVHLFAFWTPVRRRNLIIFFHIGNEKVLDMTSDILKHLCWIQCKNHEKLYDAIDTTLSASDDYIASYRLRSVHGLRASSVAITGSTMCRLRQKQDPYTFKHSKITEMS